MRSRLTYILLAGFLILGFAHAEDLRGKISIAISMDKRTFLNGELIFLDDTITNRTASELKIPKPNPDSFLQIQITDSKGNIVPGGMVANYMRVPRITLRPDGKIVRTVSLALYGNSPEGTGGAHGFVPGKYTVHVELASVKSNTLEFQILERPPAEQLVHERIGLALSGSSQPGLAIVQLKEITRLYPKSAFLPNVYEYLITYLHMYGRAEKADELFQTALEYLDRFPNFGGASHAINYYSEAVMLKMGIGLHQKLTSTELQNVQKSLRQLQKKYPSTRASRFIDEYIEKSLRPRLNKN